MKYLSLFACLFLLHSCTSQSTPNVVEGAPENINSYGEVITADGLMSAADLQAALATADSVPCTFSGEIIETCSKKGCWMTMDAGLQDEMRVTFKDYGFFVPVEGQAGKRAVVKGYAYKNVTDVDMLKHYAEDAGKSQEEIDAITEPEVAIDFKADGVLIED